MQLIQSVVEFVTQEEGGDVEALRKAMYCQVNFLLFNFFKIFQFGRIFFFSK